MTIFKQIHELERGLKTDTCRVAKPGDTVQFSDGARYAVEELVNDPDYFERVYYTYLDYPIAVYDKYKRLKACVGRDYAIVPKYGQKAIGRYELLRIHVHRVQDITEDVCVAEGFEWLPPPMFYATSVLPDQYFSSAREGYEALWRFINPKGPAAWDKNPIVIRYGFRVLHINGKQVQS
jgi:hypothetical protein